MDLKYVLCDTFATKNSPNMTYSRSHYYHYGRKARLYLIMH